MSGPDRAGPDERFVVGLRDSYRSYVQRLMDRCRPLLPDEEVVRVAWTAKKGVGANRLVVLSWFTQVLLVFQSFRVIAVTDTHIHVFTSGFVTRYKPRQLRYSVPRAAGIRDAGRGRFEVGSERLRVDQPWMQRIVDLVLTG